jgi:hypothetical protein
MSSKYRCGCGHVVQTNLFCGNKLFLLVDEENLDVEDQSVEVDKLIIESRVLATCDRCGSIALVDSDGNISRYTVSKD